MSDINKERKIVSLEDLLGKPEEQEKLVYVPELGGEIKIRKLTLGDLAKVNAFNKSKGWTDDDMRTTIGIIQRGVVEPALQYSQAENIPLVKATAIVNAISEFSGWNPKVLENTRNLSEETTESI
jgi:hypothetical protein